MKLKRSVEVIVVATIFLGLGFIVLVYLPLAYFFLKKTFAMQQQLYGFTAPFPEIRFAVLISMAAGFAFLGFFLLRLKNWSRILSLIMMSCWLIMGFVMVREAYEVGVGVLDSWLDGLILYFGPACISIYFLTRAKVIEQFNHSERYSPQTKKGLILALGSIFFLMIVYLSSPHGVWSERSLIGRMLSKLMIFISEKPAEPQNTEIRTVATESAAAEVPDSRTKPKTQHNSEKVKNSQKSNQDQNISPTEPAYKSRGYM